MDNKQKENKSCREQLSSHQLLFFQQQVNEIWSSDQCSHDACWDSGRLEQVPADGIRQQQQPAADQDGKRQEQLMAWTYNGFSDMRSHQANEGDSSGN